MIGAGVLTFIAERAAEDATALVRPGGEQMTYATLAMAVGGDHAGASARAWATSRSASSASRSDEGAGFVASVLAVLEAGGVVMPLDLRRGDRGARARGGAGAGARRHRRRSPRRIGSTSSPSTRFGASCRREACLLVRRGRTARGAFARGARPRRRRGRGRARARRRRRTSPSRRRSSRPRRF